MFEIIALFAVPAAFAGLSAIAVRLGKTAPDTAAWRISGRVNQVGRWMLLSSVGLFLTIFVAVDIAGILPRGSGTLAVAHFCVYMAVCSAFSIIAAFLWRAGLRYGTPSAQALAAVRLAALKAPARKVLEAAAAVAVVMACYAVLALVGLGKLLALGGDGDGDSKDKNTHYGANYGDFGYHNCNAGFEYNYNTGKFDNGFDPAGLYDHDLED